MRRVLIPVIGACFGLAACGGTYGEPDDVVSVPYDPDGYSQTQINEVAQSQCVARGYKTARRYEAQPTMASSNWRYQTFGCYN